MERSRRRTRFEFGHVSLGPRVFTRGAFIALLLATAGCADFDSVRPAYDIESTPQAAETVCPLSGVLDETGDLERASSPESGPSSLELHARITDITTTCALGPEGENAGEGIVNMTLEITANRGPAGSETQPLVYFVAVADPADRILSEEQFDVSLDFGGEPQVRQVEELALSVPLATGTTLNQYRVYVGFEEKRGGV